MARALNTCTFQRVPVGAEFFQNGNRCVKRSTRTADIPEYGRWFHYGKREIVEVSDEVRLQIIEQENRP